MLEVENLIGFLSTRTVDTYGAWASVVSLSISVVTLLLLRSMRAEVLLGASIEEYIESLDDEAGKISNLLNPYIGNEAEVDEVLAIINVKLRTIQKKTKSNTLKSDLKSARRGIFFLRWQYRLGQMSKEKQVRRTLTDVNVVVEELGNVKRELMTGTK
ncbi:MAG: hypothetical protein ACI8Z1_002617 [Candidatus Azotimanducaceae bacterium]|jgi:hypothetical protein